MMQCLRTQLSSSIPSTFSRTFPSPKHLRHPKPSWSSFKPYSSTRSSNRMMTSAAAQSVVEHIVLFKVKDDTDPSKVSDMVNGLSSLVTLDQVLHLTVGPILRNRSTSLTFTHMLHSRYSSKQDLDAYSAHPSHVGVVKGSVLPIIDDIMAVDWVAANIPAADLVTPPGSAVRVSFMKLKEDAGDQGKEEVLRVIRGLPESFRQIGQLSCGENFSPARAKGFSIASLAVFPGTGELEAVDSNADLVSYQKDKVRDHLESVVVVDYVVPQPQATQSANL